MRRLVHSVLLTLVVLLLVAFTLAHWAGYVAWSKGDARGQTLVVVEEFLRWATSEHVNDFLAEASLFLIFGGLSMIGLIVFLVMLRSVFPSGGPEPVQRDGSVHRRLRGTPWEVGELREPPGTLAHKPEYRDRGVRAGRQVHPVDLSAAMQAVQERNLGEPRVVGLDGGRTRVRLYRCQACDRSPAVHRDKGTGCAYPTGFLEGVFSELWGRAARVREVVCRPEGVPVCEFEVTSAT